MNLGYILTIVSFCSTDAFKRNDLKRSLVVITNLWMYNPHAHSFIWFIIGGGFFLCWPIASLYPQYRILVSPFRWVLWDIPSNSDDAVAYLRAKCDTIRIEIAERESAEESDASFCSAISTWAEEFSDDDQSLSKETILLSYRVRQGTTVGKLHLTMTNLILTRTPRALHRRLLTGRCILAVGFRNVAFSSPESQRIDAL